MKDSIIVKDDFCPHAQQVLASAHESGFGTWRPNRGEVGSSVYEGMNFVGRHDLMLRSLSAALGRPVFPSATFFRATKPGTEAAYVHSDRMHGDWTAIVYLSEHAEVSGTGFFRHRQSGLREMPTFEELRQTPEFFETLKTQMVSGEDRDWEQLDFVRGLFNRALIFHAPLFHARRPQNGLGDGTDATARIVWVCHFYI
jgi:hypothetical protein